MLQPFKIFSMRNPENANCTLLKHVPFHRRVPNTTFIVDYYKMLVSDVENTFLTHFHSDHYYGLKRSFNKNIFCSTTTANLVKLNIKVDVKYINEMEMNTVYRVDNVDIMCFEANHCPGAVGFIFCVQNVYYLHTGDFRFNVEMHANLQSLISIVRPGNNVNYFDTVFYDNTYEDYMHFDSQDDVIFNVITDIFSRNISMNTLAPIQTKYVFPSYSVGKEKLFLSVAYFFNWKVKTTEKKIMNIECYSAYTRRQINKSVVDCCERIRERLRSSSRIYPVFTKTSVQITKDCKDEPLSYVKTDLDDAVIEVIPFNYVNRVKLNELYGKTKFQRIVVICGTGWKREKRCFNLTKKIEKWLKKV
ncbi:tRNase Z [Trachipleistophora hominis]|uniref:TRNase Z n=1 Tax=Trachipleistophora hominis TaxID=72359 RepID=L7K065_TRAHO|nr:tRNase Z [Trachipleistophora hominis]